MFACSVFFIVVCLFCILYFICIFLLLLPTWRIKLMMMMMMIAPGGRFTKNLKIYLKIIQSLVVSLRICPPLMIRSCTCAVSASTWRLPASDLKCVLQMWATGWQQTDSSWTLKRRSSSGLVLSTVQLCLVAVDRHYGSEMRLSRPVIM